MDDFIKEMPASPDNLAIAIIRDPHKFSELAIHYATTRQLLERGGSKLGKTTFTAANVYTPILDEDAREVTKKIDSLFYPTSNGPSAGLELQMEIYKPFAFSHGLTTKTQWGDAAILPQDLTPEQYRLWDNYLNSVEFISSYRMLFAKALRNLIFPTVTTRYKPQNLALAMDLENTKRRVILQLIPNIDDEEALAACGPGYSSGIIKTLSTLEWFTN